MLISTAQPKLWFNNSESPCTGRKTRTDAATPQNLRFCGGPILIKSKIYMRLRVGGSAGITNQPLPVLLAGVDAFVCCGWRSSRPNDDVQAERHVQERGKSEIRGGRRPERLAPESAFLGSASRLTRLLGSEWFLLLPRKIQLIKPTFHPKREAFQIDAAFL